MCTLAIAFRARPDLPLAIAANRDEFYARPAAPPRVEDGPIPALLPIDLQAGGTWLGLNARGLFVGVTNRANGPRDTSRRSRGLLVRDALRAPSARELHARLREVRAADYNGFHLAYADLDAAFATWSDGERATQLELGPGLHVITERSFGAADERRRGLVLGKLEARLARDPAPTADELRALLAFHGPPDAPFDAGCVHVEAVGYGTRSAFDLVVDGAGRPSASWTEGPPCTSPADDLTDVVRGLLRTD
jgi:hypothetical protein